MHDRVQNSSGSGLKFSKFLASGRVRVSNKRTSRFRVGFGFQIIVLPGFGPGSGIKNSLKPVGFSGFTGFALKNS